MDTNPRNKRLAQYKDGYRVVAEALAGATDDELDARPAPGKWTAREVVHHLGDSEMTAAVPAAVCLSRVADSAPALAGALTGALGGGRSVPATWRAACRTLAGCALPRLAGTDLVELAGLLAATEPTTPGGQFRHDTHNGTRIAIDHGPRGGSRSDPRTG